MFFKVRLRLLRKIFKKSIIYNKLYYFSIFAILIYLKL